MKSIFNITTRSFRREKIYENFLYIIDVVFFFREP